MITAYKGISPQIAESAFIAPGAQIIGDVHIGEHSSVWFNCVVRGDCYYIRVGENTNIQDATIIHVTNGRFATIIGDRVTVGHSVVLHGCTVKDRSLIGIGAIVLDAMERTNWNITRAAKLLGLSFRTLQYRLEKFGMNRGAQE